jgi:hypothetical protein
MIKLKDIVEQGMAGGMASNTQTQFIKSNPNLKIINDPNFKCIPIEYRVAIHDLLKENFNHIFLKISLGIIGRESSYSSGLRFNISNPIKNVASIFADTSIGPAQMKQSTADELKIKGDINDIYIALKAVYKYIYRSYKQAKLVGYSTVTPSSNFKDGTGSAALDIAIASYNIGYKKIKKYCGQDGSNLKVHCDNPKSNGNHAINYLPNYKTERWDGVNTSTHGYVAEVAKQIKLFNCIK